ncbi:hypothetical protein [Jiella sp. M17.18]|uniref:hypothetical protein n=1 Tax=Jiella sp. M17.18 TaxID=3234247 RepID=UPI0034DE859C
MSEREITASNAPAAAQAAVRNAIDYAAALTDAIDKAARLGIRLDLRIEERDERGRSGLREVVVEVPRHDEGRRPEDLNSANDD